MNSAPQRWATPLPGAIALLGLGVVLAVAAAASYAEPPALVLLAVAALVVIASAVVALVRRPRLVLAPGPVLTVGTLRGRFSVTPEEIDSVEMLSTRRLAFRSRQLLIELDDGRLLVFGRWDLGAEPRHVAEQLVAAGLVLNDRTRDDGDIRDEDPPTD
ncbi:PH domain-containing protein [Gordonia caeni]|uniref:Low molecular weight protein antigen 6 PH domain-containing protein n=1 Tax=Gordonia caeni TaxID=1007097 RepID=A0ABP7NJQ8_9ACTN